MEYRITNVQDRDEWDSQYGRMKTYAIALEGESGWHSLNQKLSTPPPREGDTIAGFIENKETRGGTPYKKFVKQNPKFAGGGGGGSAPATGPVIDKLDYIIQLLEKLTGDDQKPADDYDKPLTADDIPDVFNDPFEGKV